MDQPDYYAGFEKRGELGVRDDLAANRYSEERVAAASEWLRRQDQARIDAAQAEQATTARSAASAAWEAASAAKVAASAALEEASAAKEQALAANTAASAALEQATQAKTANSIARLAPATAIIGIVIGIVALFHH
jgi:hypothetical protein